MKVGQRDRIIAVGVNSDGCSEVPGMDSGLWDPEPFRTEFLRERACLGLQGVTLVISDAPEGLGADIAHVLCAAWQR